MQSIVQHALKKKLCNTTYSPLQISDLKALSKEISDAKHKVKMAERYQTKKNEKAMEYQRKKNENPIEYQKLKDYKAKKYQETKFDIAKKYAREKIENHVNN